MNKLYHILDIIVIMQNMTTKHTSNKSDDRNGHQINHGEAKCLLRFKYAQN